ncbi:MAG: Copper binding protein plastocyanin/azurin family [Acidobacteriaceae bacterium]|nr:Copper binding protein plastocyanin/azurin family [Acidobacteriaceae bacterium]
MHLRYVFLFVLLLAGCSSTKQETAQQSSQLATPIDPATVATVTGTITFSGDAPKPEKIDMSQDPACVIGTEPNYSQSFAVDKGRLQNVYVYIKDGLGNRVFATPSEAATLDQHGCRYVPHVMGVMLNQKLRILNSDVAMHNIHPAAEVNQSWNVSQSPKGDPIEQSFSKPELMIPVKCNQHPWMKMYLNVSPHPFFSVSQKDGTFEIKGLPPGEYTIAAVHERMGEKTQKITLGAKETKSVDFAFTAADSVK